MIVDCCSDLHGFFPHDLQGGDLLIIAGDLTAKHTDEEYMECLKWMNVQNYYKVIYIAGNHDPFCIEEQSCVDHVIYLCDSGTEFEYFDKRFPEEDEGFLPSGKRKLKIWGSPWSLTFDGINPNCTAFTGKEWDLAKKWREIPKDTDILITHSPPYGILDKTIDGENVGSKTLLHSLESIKPRLHIFGHIHEAYGQIESETDYVNCSHVNEYYKPVNKPIRVIL